MSTIEDLGMIVVPEDTAAPLREDAGAVRSVREAQEGELFVRNDPEDGRSYLVVRMPSAEEGQRPIYTSHDLAESGKGGLDILRVLFGSGTTPIELRHGVATKLSELALESAERQRQKDAASKS